MGDLQDSNPVGAPSLGSPGPETREMKAALAAKMFDARVDPLRFGRYRVVGRIGRGGMGAVFRAVDPDLDRHVAVKVLRRSATTEATRATMVREARTMARLSHPNVVAVLEVGLEDDEVFVAMEYVDGGTLREWCLQHPLGSAGRFERALDLALQSLHGLAAAHDAGLVHRDLKPSNMLVGSDGRLRIADFGLARDAGSRSQSDTLDPDAPDESSGRLQQLDRLHATSRDAVVGTPLYMAPEQFQGRATTSSDIFSWCVSFHEVFFGTRPFAADTTSGLQQQIAAQRFVAPSKSARAPAWLRPILLRGLDVEPDRRWPSAAALLQAIESRRRPRRWPWVAGSVAALAVVGVVARVPLAPEPVIAPCSDDRARLDAVWGAEARNAIHDNLERAGVAYGPATWDRVRGRMEELATRWKSDRLDACRQGRDRDPEPAAVGRRRTACLDRALHSFAFVADALSDQERTVAPYAVSLLLALGDKVGCEGDDLQASDGEAFDAEAVADLDRAFLLDEARRGPEAIAVLTDLAARLPVSSRLRARALLALAEVHANLGPTSGDAALEAARESLAAAEAAGDPALLVNAWRMLARAETAYGDPEDARFAIERAGNLATRPEIDDLERARIEGAHAGLLEHDGNFVEAAEHYRKAIEWHRKMRADSVGLAFLLVDASGPLLMASAPDEAVAASAQAVALCDELLGPEHPETALALIRSAQIGVQVGRDGVLDELDRAAAILSANPHFHAEALVDVRMTQADLLLRARRFAEALVAIDGAIAALDASVGPDEPFRIALGLFRGKILLGLERPEDASAEARLMLERFAGVGGPMARAYSEVHMVLARAEATLGHTQEARKELTAARVDLDTTYDATTVPGHNYRVRVAEILAATGDHDAALTLLEELAAHVSDEFPPIEHAQMWLAIASSRHAQHDETGATKALDRARAFVDPKDPELRASLAEVEARLGVTPSE